MVFFNVRDSVLFEMFKAQILEILDRKQVPMSEKSVIVDHKDGILDLNIVFIAPALSNLHLSKVIEIEDELKGDIFPRPVGWAKKWADCCNARRADSSSLQIHTFVEFNHSLTGSVSLEFDVPRCTFNNNPENLEGYVKYLPNLIKDFTERYRDHIEGEQIEQYLKILRSVTFALRAGSIKVEFVWSAGIPLGLRFLVKGMEYLDRETAKLKFTHPTRLISIEAGINDCRIFSPNTSCLDNSCHSLKDLLSQLGFSLLQNIYKYIPETSFPHASVSRLFASALRSNRTVIFVRRSLDENSELCAKSSRGAVRLNLTQIHGGNHLLRLKDFMDSIPDIIKSSSPLDNVGAIDMTSCRIGDLGAELLGKFLALCKSLCRLQLLDNRLGCKGCKFIIAGLSHNSSISRIGLGSNQLRADSVLSLSNILNLRNLLVLDLVDNFVGDEGLDHVTRKLGNVTGQNMPSINKATIIENLCLRMNQISDKGAILISKVLTTCSSLSCLDLAFNRICDAGAKHILSALAEAEFIFKIDMRRNFLSDRFGHTMSNFVLKKFARWAQRGKVQSEKAYVLNGVQILAVHKMNKSYEILWQQNFDLSFTQIGSAEVVMLADLISGAKGLVRLNLRGNLIGNDSILALRELASFIDVDVSENPCWQRFIDHARLEEEGCLREVTMNGSEPEKSDLDCEKILLTVRCHRQDDFSFEISRSEELSKPLKRFCDSRNLKFAALRFTFDGRFLKPSDCPDQLQMINFDQIDCIEHSSRLGAEQDGPQHAAICAPGTAVKVFSVFPASFKKEPNSDSRWSSAATESTDREDNSAMHALFGPNLSNCANLERSTQQRFFEDRRCILGSEDSRKFVRMEQQGCIDRGREGFSKGHGTRIPHAKDNEFESRADEGPFMLHIVDPKYPDRGIRSFVNIEGDTFQDCKDPCRLVRFRFIHDNTWRNTGSVHIGQRVLLVDYTKGGKINLCVYGTVKGWLSKDESDFLDSNQLPAALYRVQRDDKIFEDLEEHELLDARACWAVKQGLSIYKPLAQGGSSDTECVGVFYWRYIESYVDAVVIWQSRRPEQVTVSALVEQEVRVRGEAGLWSDMALSDFIALESPYPFRDCIDIFKEDMASAAYLKDTPVRTQATSGVAKDSSSSELASKDSAGPAIQRKVRGRLPATRQRRVESGNRSKLLHASQGHESKRQGIRVMPEDEAESNRSAFYRNEPSASMNTSGVECVLESDEGSPCLPRKPEPEPVEEHVVFGAQCQQCEQWRVTPRQYMKSERFLCRDLYSWEKRDGVWTGGCNASPDCYPAFDTKQRESSMTLYAVRMWVGYLLDKLPRAAIRREWKERMMRDAEDAEKRSNPAELLDVVRGPCIRCELCVSRASSSRLARESLSCDALCRVRWSKKMG